VSRIFRTEGPLLEREANLYVERPEDREVVSDVRGGNYVALIGPRQMGKTSLLLRLRRRLLREGHLPIYFDPSPARDREQEAWYRYFHSVVQGQLQRDEPSVSVPPMRDHLDFREALREISRQLAATRQVVVLLDEVSALPPDISDLFFSTIRTVFNEREPFPAFRRYVFVMAGTFIPDQLVKDSDISPFNIATRVYTSDADKEKLGGLVRNLAEAGPSPSDAVLDRIYSWTEGHLYLTQRLCSRLEKRAQDELSPDDVDAVVEAMMSDRNVEHIYSELSDDVELEEVLQRILEADRPLRFSRASSIIAELALIGVIKPDTDGCCRIRNAIYRKALGDKYPDLEPDEVGELTRLEHRLFEYFCRNVNTTCTYYEIAEKIWGQGSFAEQSIEDRIYQLVARLRRKVKGDPANTLEIMTVRGRGYKPYRTG